MRGALRLAALPIVFPALAAGAGELVVDVRNAPGRGQLVFQVYDDADAFGDFRDPAQEVRLAARGDG